MCCCGPLAWTAAVVEKKEEEMVEGEDALGVVEGRATARPVSEDGRGRAGRRTRVVEDRVSSRLEPFTTAAIVVVVRGKRVRMWCGVFLRVSIL